MLINNFGMLYRISKRNWKRFCKAQAEGREEEWLKECGAKFVGHIDHNITDWNREDFAEEIGMEVTE